MISCAVGITLLIGSIYMSFDDKKADYFMRFYNSLDDSQRQRYESIVRERLMIYITGMMLGIVSACLLYTSPSPRD